MIGMEMVLAAIPAILNQSGDPDVSSYLKQLFQLQRTVKPISLTFFKMRTSMNLYKHRLLAYVKACKFYVNGAE